MKKIKVGSVCDNVIDGVVVEKNVVVIGVHPVDENLMVVKNRFGEYVAPRKNLVLVKD